MTAVLVVFSVVALSDEAVQERQGAAGLDEPKPTMWMSPDGLPRPEHEVPVYRFPARIKPIALPARTAEEPVSLSASQDRICLVVENSLYDSVSVNLLRHVQDLEDEGYSVVVYLFTPGTAEDLRSFLLGLYEDEESLVGAELIGDIPHVIFELMQSFGSGSWYEDFPCDIFYMDLDGVWEDTLEYKEVHAGNGKYDTRSGNLDLEIWVSRLKTGNLTDLGTESDVLNNYFDKSHDYRTGILSPAARGLVYDDDDWAHWAEGDKDLLIKLYGNPNTTMISDAETTTADDYKSNRVPVDQEFILTRSHGAPDGHGYAENFGADFGYVFASDYRSIDPPALFYSFFVCSGCDYTWDNNLGGTAAFNQDSGLLAVGSTKTGGMWKDQRFYVLLFQGHCFGYAFKEWFNQVQSDWPSLTPKWWYGMVLIGDAALHPTVLRNISGELILPHPGWQKMIIDVAYQLREPGTMDVFIEENESILVFYDPAAKTSMGMFLITGVPDGTYDFAMKHPNHIGDMKPVIISGSDVFGMDITFWAGDCDGNDGMWDAEPGDNDVDWFDYYVLYYQYIGEIPITAGEGSDFDGDGDVDFDDYYGLYYGYLENPDPGNWY